MVSVHRAMKLVPISLGIAGRRRQLIFSLFDGIYRNSAQKTLDTNLGTFDIKWENSTERYLSYCFYNLLRHYRESDLGHYILNKPDVGKVFIDIGANLGFYSLLARQSGFETIAIEPEPAHMDFIRRNTHLLGPALFIAVSDNPGSLPLYYAEGNTGAATLCNFPGYVKGKATVPVDTFDNLVFANKFGPPEHISLIKVDVEGREGEAVAGMRRFLKQGYRPNIWCEVRGDKATRAVGSYHLVSETLREFGYLPHDYIGGVLKKPSDDELSKRVLFDLLFIAN